jgi:ribose-phosphate pyrophosphokinase
MSELKIIVPENFKEFGDKVNKKIQTIRKTNDNFLVNTSLVRFNNGEGKAVIKESLRDKDLYIMSDVSNYDVSYNYYGRTHYMSPDEHFMDIKRILSAECGHASKRTVVMPYLYQSRQDKKDSRESLDCALALKELEYMGVNEIVTCDVHNKSVMNAVPNMAFENMYLGDIMLLDLIEHEKIHDFDKFVCISPDEGAMKRARFFSDLLGNVGIGSFYKQRDYTKVVNGKNPIVDHRFLGPSDMEGKYAIISDDMIASGGSILDTALSLKKLGVERIYLIVTFALFTEGIDMFKKYYREGKLDGLYVSNLSYIPEEYKNEPWLHVCDCSRTVAEVIYDIHNDLSITSILTDKSQPLKLLEKKFKKDE